jgi:hypothetical protein
VAEWANVWTADEVAGLVRRDAVGPYGTLFALPANASTVFAGPEPWRTGELAAFTGVTPPPRAASGQVASSPTRPDSVANSLPAVPAIGPGPGTPPGGIPG